MSKTVFDQIAEGLEEALTIARGDAEPFKLHVPVEVDVKAIRVKTRLSQREFSETFGFGLDQLKQWEQKRSRPVQALKAYLLLIDSDPVHMVKALRALEIPALSEEPEAIAAM